MNDPISRADLFDELNRRGVPYNAEVNMVINGMPSVQPKTQLSTEDATFDTTFDCISRRAAIDALNSLQKFSLIDSNEYLQGVGVRLKFAVQTLEQLPPAQPERKTGRWISMEVSSGRDSWKCSVCGRRARGKLENLPYCHCGAKMEVEHGNQP